MISIRWHLISCGNLGTSAAGPYRWIGPSRCLVLRYPIICLPYPTKFCSIWWSLDPPILILHESCILFFLLHWDHQNKICVCSVKKQTIVSKHFVCWNCWIIIMSKLYRPHEKTQMCILHFLRQAHNGLQLVLAKRLNVKWNYFYYRVLVDNQIEVYRFFSVKTQTPMLLCDPKHPMFDQNNSESFHILCIFSMEVLQKYNCDWKFCENMSSLT